MDIKTALPFMKRFGLKSLSHILACEEIAIGDRNMTQIAAACPMTNAGATSLVDRLERLKLVTRSREHDRRIVIVNFTPAGQKAWDEIVNAK